MRCNDVSVFVLCFRFLREVENSSIILCNWVIFSTFVVMMLNMKIYKFDPVVYPRKLYVARGSDVEVLHKYFVQRDGSVIGFGDDADNPSVCSVIPCMSTVDGKFGVLVLMRGDMGVSDVSHEAVHVAMGVFRDIGSYVDADNQEPFAYLVGWVAKCIWAAKSGKADEWGEAGYNRHKPR